MVSGKPKVTGSDKINKKKKKATTSLHNPKTAKFKKKKTAVNKKQNATDQTTNNNNDKETVAAATASHQRTYFLNEYQSANAVQLSSLELESIQETSFVELLSELGHDVESLGEQLKAVFGKSWKETLCEGKIEDGKIEAGSPAVLIIGTSALRSIDLLRGVRSLTKGCRAVKLFSKHMRVEEQVALLKNRVNLASGTPSRIKKLIDIEALGLSRLKVIVLDMHMDVKGYSLLTLPQVRDEFWDLYKNYFHQRLMEGDLRICLFGPIPNDNELKGKKRKGTR